MIKVAKAIIECQNFLSNSKEKYLLLRRSNQSKFFPGQWDFPGGKLKENESPDSAVIREIKEETALEIKIEKLALEGEHKEQREIIRYHIFKVKSYSGKVRLSKDHNEFAWLNVEEIKKKELTPFVKVYFKL